ncbi:MAG: hypothetical protein ACOYMA_05225 [Bacteroidia bacterium]
MKSIKFLAILLVLLFAKNSNSQNINDYGIIEKKPAFYLGIGTGINNSCGLAGFKLGIRLNDKLILDAGVGVGSWGSKVALGMVFNAIDKNAWCPVLSISRASGINDAIVKLEVVDDFGIKSKKDISMDLTAATMFNLGIQRQWERKSGNRLVLDLGFSILVDGASHENIDYTIHFSDKGKRDLDLLKPGGLMVGFSYNFGVN